MEPESSLPCSQQPATGSCPQPEESNLKPDIQFPKVHFNNVLPIYAPCSEWCLSLEHSNQLQLFIF
jgi:hypothetical protein